MTNFEEIFNRALHRIEKDTDFFSYYHVESQSDVEELIRQQLTSYLYDAIDKIYDKGTPKINFYDYDIELQEFNIDLTKREIGLLSNLVFLVYLERQEAMLGAFKVRMTPSDLTVFSPASERNSFLNLVKDVRQECDIALSRYFSTDREDLKRKTIDHSQYDYS